MYKSNELESTFREIVNKNKKNLIIGCIYRHPPMNLEEFNDLAADLFEKLENENKKICLMGDINIDLLKIDNVATANLFDDITKNLLVPDIVLPKRITPSLKTDNLAQFLILPIRQFNYLKSLIEKFYIKFSEYRLERN